MTPTPAQLLRRAQTTVDADELVDIGCDLADVGELDGAEYCFRRATDLGDATAAFNLGNCLAEQDRFREAVDAYEVALARGEADAWLNLGLALGELGDLTGEVRAYEQAERAGDSGGALMLAFSLREQGQRDAAFEAAERASAAGNDRAAAVVASWRWNESLDASLESALRTGAELYPSARADLADLLVTTGRIEEGRSVLARGMELGEVESMVPLGNLYAVVLGDDAAAEAAFRAAAELGEPHAHHNLAVMLAGRGDLDGAERHFRIAAETGDTLAQAALHDLLDD